MAYLQQLAAGAASPVGAPPPSAAPNVGAPPPIPSTEPPPYDALQDPAWRGFVDPQNHALRTFINELSPEHRQMLLSEFMKHKAQAMLNQPPRMPAAPMAGPPGAGPVFPPQ